MTDVNRRGGRGHSTIEAHPQRADIDRALVAGGVPLAKLARQFGVSQDALRRRRRAGVSPDLAAVTVEPVALGDATLDVPAEYLAQFRHAEQALAAAQATHSSLAVTNALRERRQSLADIARWNAEQQRIAALTRTHEAVRLWDFDDWRDFKAVLDAVLGEFDRLYAPDWPAENRLAISLANALDVLRAHDLKTTLAAIQRGDITRAPQLNEGELVR